jgi:hypothetical protein
MTDRDALADRLDAVEEELGDTSTMGGSGIVYTTDDGYETPQGEPIPPADTFGSLIVLSGEYAPRDGDDARGDA